MPTVYMYVWNWWLIVEEVGTVEASNIISHNAVAAVTLKKSKSWVLYKNGTNRTQNVPFFLTKPNTSEIWITEWPAKNFTYAIFVL